MDSAARDSWRVFHDLCAFSSGDSPIWLTGLNTAKVKKSFCLEMIENLLEQYPNIFRQMNQFTFLLKEKVCNIVIKLFSPGCKYQDTSTSGPWENLRFCSHDEQIHPPKSSHRFCPYDTGITTGSRFARTLQ